MRVLFDHGLIYVSKEFTLYIVDILESFFYPEVLYLIEKLILKLEHPKNSSKMHYFD